MYHNSHAEPVEVSSIHIVEYQLHYFCGFFTVLPLYCTGMTVDHNLFLALHMVSWLIKV